ncbi:MAG TPA: hypothetical protein P5539_15495 [Mesotoga sp.]|nr:hypothetical protein [Mesotoga sp.]
MPTTAGHDLIDVNTGVNVEVFELSFATATKMLDLEVHPLKTACVKALFALQKSLPSLTFDDDFFNVTRVRVTSALGRLAQRVDIDSVFSDDHSGWLFAFQIEVHMAIG